MYYGYVFLNEQLHEYLHVFILQKTLTETLIYNIRIENLKTKLAFCSINI